MVGAERNTELAARIYPDWVCRFYVDETVPSKTLEKLNGSPNVEIKYMPRGLGFSGLFWRFLAVSDPEAEVVIVRDADSRLSTREYFAVEAWLRSQKPFHIMRDHPWHRNPILGGMWGCSNTSLLDIETLMSPWQSRVPIQHNDDQEFLAKRVYPLMRRHGVLVHDEVNSYHRFPVRRKGGEFVGQVFDENEHVLHQQTKALECALRRPRTTRLHGLLSRVKNRW